MIKGNNVSPEAPPVEKHWFKGQVGTKAATNYCQLWSKSHYAPY